MAREERSWVRLCFFLRVCWFVGPGLEVVRTEPSRRDVKGGTAPAPPKTGGGGRVPSDQFKVQSGCLGPKRPFLVFLLTEGI